MLTELNIRGHRQHGKTYLLEHVVVDELRQGRRVLYLTESRAMCRESFLRVLYRLEGIGEVHKSVRSTGQERIEHDRGGVILFQSVRGSAGRGVLVDTVIADGMDQFPGDWRVRVLPALTHSQTPRLFTAEATTE